MSSDLRKIPHVHVSGVGGVGMNAIAQLYAADGWRVSGSDRFWDQGESLPVFDALKALGVELLPQDGAALTAETRALIISSAVEADNPERVRAASLGIPEVHRAAALAEFTQRGDLASIAGTSGKTTCSGWLGWVLAECGLDPNVVNGGGILGWKNPASPGNVRLGPPGNVWVAEVDESDKSLLRFSPRWALITTLTADHWPLDETIGLFRDFAARVRETIVCGPGVAAQLRGDPRIRAELLEVGQGIDTPLPGEHNRINAACVLRLAEYCGADPQLARRALATFQGIERRLQRCSPPGSSAAVFDDYGHNPEKIAAAIRAVQTQTGRVTVLWRPHGFAPLRQNFEALATAFADTLRAQDEAWILPVFYAGGTAPKGIEGADLAAAIGRQGKKALALEQYPATVDLAAGDVLLVMGARDPELPRFAERIGRAQM